MPVVNKTLLRLVTALSFVLAALPGAPHAAAAGSDYIALQVPDLRQAVSFFHDVMNCNALSGDGNASMTGVALLDCGRQTVVELTESLAPAGREHAAPARDRVTLNADDATNLAVWLRVNRIRLIGKPVHIAAGTEPGKIAVNFLTPWGQPLELVSRISGDDRILERALPSATVAAQ